MTGRAEADIELDVLDDGTAFATVNMNIGWDESEESVLRCFLSFDFNFGCRNSVKWFGFFL